jgi:hypothetical protein
MRGPDYFCRFSRLELPSSGVGMDRRKRLDDRVAEGRKIIRAAASDDVDPPSSSQPVMSTVSSEAMSVSAPAS